MKKSKLSTLTVASLILAGVFGVQAVLALRQNSLEASRLLQQVFVADEEGGDVEGALTELRSYVFSHMNTDLSRDNSIYPPIQLKYTYERLVQAEKKRVESAAATIYNDAQNFCESQNPTGFYGATRLGCIENYIKTQPIPKERPIEDDLYKFNFASPTWTPDKAGVSLLASLFFAVIAVSSFLARKVSDK